ncbi:unnamed protein product [Prunus armeniaca]
MLNDTSHEVYYFVAQNSDVDRSLRDEKWLFYATEKLFARRNRYFVAHTSSSTYLYFAIAKSECKENFEKSVCAVLRCCLCWEFNTLIGTIEKHNVV